MVNLATHLLVLLFGLILGYAYCMQSFLNNWLDNFEELIYNGSIKFEEDEDGKNN